MKAIIFDFDGTLADSLLLGLSGVNQLANKFSYQAFQDTEYLRSKGVQEIIKEDLGLKWYQFPFYLLALKRILMPEIPKLELHETIPESLARLEAQARLFILTSNIEPAVRHVLGRYELKCFEGIYTDASLFRKHSKLKRLLRRHKLLPNEAVYVGDEVRDIIACRKIGMPIVSVSWGFNNAKKLAEVGPDFVAHSPQQLVEILETEFLAKTS
ncbi:MAG: HAD hydrolase-like protein [Bacteroidota bacterium]